MIKKLSVLFIILSMIDCNQVSREVVAWFPEILQQGEKIRIVYNPTGNEAVIIDAQRIDIIYQFFFKDSNTTMISKMHKRKNYWEVHLEIPGEATLLSFKFEDDKNLVDHQSGRGWIVPICDKGGNRIENTYYWWGQIYLGGIRPDAFPYFKKANELFEKEIKLFPKNYKAYLAKWESELNLNTLDRVKLIGLLDSLVKADPANEELQTLSFHVYSRILNDPDRALQIAGDLTRSGEGKDLDEIVYQSIFLRTYTKASQLIGEMENFVTSYPRSRFIESICFRLGNYYLQMREESRAKICFEKLNERDPENLPNKLTLASMEVNNKNYEIARRLLEEAKSICTEETLKKKNLWLHPGKRKNQLSLDLCQVYSSTAKLAYEMGDFEESIKHRKRVIDLGTPFPAFEWVEIGNASLRLKRNEDAESAFLRAIAINSEQEDAIQKLKTLYLARGGEGNKFEAYLENEIREQLKISQKPAPDFEAVDLDEERVRLFDLKGKIVVLCFWDSWNTTCLQEIPHLNELVEELRNVESVVFWAISSEYKSSIKRVIENTLFNYRQFYNGAQIEELLGVIGYPTHIIIDTEGIIRFKYVGYTIDIKQRLRQNIQYIIKERNIIS